MAKYDHIDFVPPAGAREEAARGLEWRSEFGRGGTAVGIARARDIKNGKRLSPETVKRMKAFFDRHQSDKEGEGWSPGEKGYPSNGRIAHALWGGSPGYSWARKVVRQMEAADERSLDVGEQKRFGFGEVEKRSVCVEDNADFPLLSIETRSEEIESNGERREVKRDWIVGYAARFGVNSLDMGDFVERIDPGAFRVVSERRGRKKPLETRALFNHDPNHVLGRYPDTLRLIVDERGLRYEVLPPESRADIVESIRRGDIKGSSFSFTIGEGGETWSNENGRSVRTVTKIEALYDVGPVTYPAYPDSDVTVAKRSYDEFMSRSARREQERAERRKKIDGLREYLASKHGS